MKYFRKIMIFSLVILVLTTPCLGASKSSKKERTIAAKSLTIELPYLSDVLHFEAMNSSSYNLCIKHGKIEECESMDMVIENFNRWLSEKKDQDQKSKGDEAVSKLRKYGNAMKAGNSEKVVAIKYKENILDFLKSGRHRQLIFVKGLDEVKPPIRFVDIENKPALLLTKVASPNVYNTLTTTPRTRSAKVVSSMIVPMMRIFSESFAKTDLKYFGVAVFYGTRDFSKDRGDKPEMVTLVTSIANCIKYADGKISEDEFVNLSDVYLKSEDDFDARKIKIKLE